LLGLLGAVGVGCSPYVQRGEVLYQDGRYIEAAEMFELTEARLASSTAEVRAEYGLYRGLTYLRLDDLKNARQWLAYAYTMDHGNPDLLDTGERAMLGRGWNELEHRSNPAGVASTAETAAKVAQTEPAATARTAAPDANGRRSVAPE
jgi:tetratricopeptide (TPR) repeat protein